MANASDYTDPRYLATLAPAAGTLPTSEDFSELAVAIKQEAHDRGYADGQQFLDGRVAGFACPDYPDGYLTYLYHLGFGQAIINEGRTIAGINFKRGAATGEGKAAKMKAEKRLPNADNRRGW